MGTRKNATRLSATERDNFLRAVLKIKNTIANPGDPPNLQISIYDQFVALHLYAININFGGQFGLNMGHQDSAFCPWHRYYLLKLEQALQSVDPTVTLPYWDWTDHFATEHILFQDNHMGPNGTGTGASEKSVKSGYFAFNRPGTGGNPTPLPGWWPAGLPGWRVRPSLAQGHADSTDPATGNTLQRNLGAFANLANLSDIQGCMTKTSYEGTTTANSFRRNLEAAAKTHNFHHGWVGGNMGDPNSSPNDLIFFLHHCNIDRLWAMWQIDGHAGAAFYPLSGRPQGHNLPDPMWPWVGAAAGYSSGNAQPDIVLPNFTASPVIHPADVLDHRALGYCYDTEAIVGIALDQTGSMNQLTPDPMVTTSPDVTKWEAAKRGVAALLHDCETAYAQKEAYVFAGVETFRNLGTNTFIPVFPGVPYGLVKGGGVYSEAGFNSAIATQNPGGGTPIGGALLDTESNLVRAPLNNLPAQDTRFLMFLTDGMENVPPLLSSIGAGQLQDTVVFAMGFGTGTDVNYATIANIVSKGKAAPAGANQVYHGENAGEINKFFTNSIAHALGYTPVLDPIYELFPGEHVDSAFYVNEADQSFMITVQGFDFQDENWQCCLLLPDGSACNCDASCDEHEDKSHSHDAPIHSHAHGSFLVTSNKSNGRTTVFLNRNGAESEHWVGRWFVRVMYKMTSENMRMFMPSLFDRLLPAGSRPVRGPVFAQLAMPVAKRTSMRLMPARADSNVNFPVTGVSDDRKDPGSVAVNVYCRSTLQILFSLNQERVFTGDDFRFTLEAKEITGADVSQITAIGRMVAPHFSAGNIYLENAVIPVAQRKKFIQRTDSGNMFDEARFFAQHELKKPGIFTMRDEIIRAESSGKNKAVALISNNRYPGIHRIGLQVSGSVTYGNGEPQDFTRTLNYEIPVGIKVDTGKLDAKLRLTKNSLSVTYSIADKHGNHASPALPDPCVLKLNGKEVTAAAANDYSGTRSLEVNIPGKGIRLSADGKKVLEGTAVIALVDGETIAIKPGSPFRLQLEIGNKTVNLSPPLKR